MDSTYRVINIRDYMSGEPEDRDTLAQLIQRFSCSRNPFIEQFLMNQAVEFTKKNQSVTYVVISRNNNEVVGYFTLAIKSLNIDTSRFSNTIRKKIARVGRQKGDGTEYTLAAYLIAQLGKNDSPEISSSISGKDLLNLAMQTIYDLQYRVGGMVMFLEAENQEKLMKFYIEQNGFRIFDTRVASGTMTEPLVQMLRVM